MTFRSSFSKHFQPFEIVGTTGKYGIYTCEPNQKHMRVHLEIQVTKNLFGRFSSIDCSIL